MLSFPTSMGRAVGPTSHGLPHPWSSGCGFTEYGCHGLLATPLSSAFLGVIHTWHIAFLLSELLRRDRSSQEGADAPAEASPGLAGAGRRHRVRGGLRGVGGWCAGPARLHPTALGALGRPPARPGSQVVPQTLPSPPHGSSGFRESLLTILKYFINILGWQKAGLCFAKHILPSTFKLTCILRKPNLHHLPVFTYFTQTSFS